MDKFKIDLFESEYKISFPEFKTLNDSECQRLVNNLSEKYNLTGDDIELALASKQTFYKKVNATENFKLINTLTELEITPTAKIIINWSGFKRLDELKIEDLNRYFDDIWFPSSDDIDLFDNTLNWIMSIRHDGCVSFLTNSNVSK